MTLTKAIGASVQRVDGAPFWSATLPEGASLTVAAGEFVDLTSGYLRRAGNLSAGNPLGASDVVLGRIAGAGQNASAGAKENVVVIADDQTLFSIPVWNAGGTAELSQANLGLQYEIYFTSGSIWVMDIGETTDVKVVYVGFDASVDQTVPGFRDVLWSSSEGELYGYALAKFLPAARQFG